MGTRGPTPTTTPDMAKHFGHFRNWQVLRPCATGPPRSQRATELALAKPNGLGSDLHQLVVVDPGQTVLQTHGVVRSQTHGLVVAGGAHVGQLLLPTHVDVEVHVTRVLADHHPLVHRRPWRYEEDAALLEVKEGVRRRDTFP